MSTRADLIEEYGRANTAPLGTLTDLRQKLDAYRSEVLAEDGQAYDGELAMLRGLVRVLRTVVRENDTLDEVRRLLWQHLADDGDARGEKGSREADATPNKVASRERRLDQLLDTIRTHGGKWSTGTLQELRRRHGGTTQRGTARRDLAELHRRGHLNQHGAGDGRFYTLKTRKDGRT